MSLDPARQRRANVASGRVPDARRTVTVTRAARVSARRRSGRVPEATRAGALRRSGRVCVGATAAWPVTEKLRVALDATLPAASTARTCHVWRPGASRTCTIARRGRR